MTTAQPVEAEREGAVVSVEVRRDGVAVITLDDARQTLNTITPAFGAQLAAAVDRVESDASIAAAVLVSGKPDSFVAGANIGVLKSIKFATDAERMAREAALLMRRVERLNKPVVAAIHGAALGGGFELALACHAILLSDDPRTVLGLPEVRLGLLPAANGMLRIAQRAGLREAMDLALSGKNLRAARARSLGLCDEVCPRAILVETAARRAKTLVGHVPRHRVVPVDLTAIALERNPIGRALLFKRARERARVRTRSHYPAPERILAVLERFARSGFDAAATLEAKAFGDLVVSETAHRLIELFFATTALKRDVGVDEVAEARVVTHLGVIGGGMMGSGIAYVTVDAGLPVRLKEKDDAAAGRALRAVNELLDARVARQALTPLERDAILARLSATADPSGLRHAGLVVEAVFEDLALKQATLRQVEALVEPACVYASNTSSIPIARIAQAASFPGRVLGMHYFSPVPRMPLLEVVRADRTEPWAVATAVALGKRQGKTVIVVKDGPGFYTTRVLAPMLNEAAHLVGEGVAVDAVDAAMVGWGFPVGPLQLLDEVGIDVAARVAQVLHAAFGERMTPPGALSKLVADERSGRKSGRGIYRYDEQAGGGEGRRPVDAGVYALLGVQPTTRLPPEEIQMRCALALVNEAIRCFGEGVLRSARDGDVGAVLGLGFPPFRGGPFRYVDTLGAAEALRRVQGYADRFGERWRPAPLLVHMAKKGERFFD
ncbi:MAG TPA: fatty acid oxidation complex subunit alpha FadJ [Polyangiaceae bacterium]